MVTSSSLVEVLATPKSLTAKMSGTPLLSKRRILGAILAVSTAAVLLFGVPVAVVVARYADESAVLGLERRAVLAARDSPTTSPATPPTRSSFGGAGDVDFGLYDNSGRLVPGVGPPRADLTSLGALANRVGDDEVGETLVVAVPVAADETVAGAQRAQQPTAVSDARVRCATLFIAALALAVLAMARPPATWSPAGSPARSAG